MVMYFPNSKGEFVEVEPISVFIVIEEHEEDGEIFENIYKVFFIPVNAEACVKEMNEKGYRGFKYYVQEYSVIDSKTLEV